MASLGKGEDDVGSKRIRDTKDGGFVMCKGGGEGERVEIEDTPSIPTAAETQPRNNREDEDEDEDATPKDPAEALAQLFHECMQNLAYLSTVAKLSSSSSE